MFKATPPQPERREDKVELSQQEPSTGARPGQTQHSLISADTAVTGDLVSSGDISIEGRVDGTITCRALTLQGNPFVTGSVQAESVHVCGCFDGELRAKKVILVKTAKMTGDIHQETLEIHPGAWFEGNVKHVKADQTGPEARGQAEPAKEPKESQEVEQLRPQLRV
jgi:cytoskeletal protein CcmA (bactofilin family)